MLENEFRIVTVYNNNQDQAELALQCRGFVKHDPLLNLFTDTDHLLRKTPRICKQLRLKTAQEIHFEQNFMEDTVGVNFFDIVEDAI